MRIFVNMVNVDEEKPVSVDRQLCKRSYFVKVFENIVNVVFKTKTMYLTIFIAHYARTIVILTNVFEKTLIRIYFFNTLNIRV